jgi:hypothetical protein
MLVEKMLAEIDEEVNELEAMMFEDEKKIKRNEKRFYKTNVIEAILFEDEKKIKRDEDGILQDVTFLLGEKFDKKTIERICRTIVDRKKVLKAFFAPWSKRLTSCN